MGYSRTKKTNTDQYAEKMPFNNSFGKLERLNLWWEAAGKAKAEGLTDQYYNLLENIYTELFAHLTEEETKEIDKELIAIERFLDQSNVPQGFSHVAAVNHRIGSNKCDKLARHLSVLSKKYNLEWFDIQAWTKQQRDIEPVMRG